MPQSIKYTLLLLALLVMGSNAFAHEPKWFSAEGVQVGRRVGSDDGAYGDVYSIDGPGIPPNSVVKLYRPAIDLTGGRHVPRETMIAYYDGMELIHGVLGEEAVKPYGLVEYNGIPGIVMERYPIEGFSFDVKYPSAKSSYVNRRTIVAIRQVFAILMKERIHHHDMQIRVMPGGTIKLFDTDLAYRIDQPPSIFSPDEISHTPEQDMQALAIDVLQRFITDNDLHQLACYATGL